MSSVSGQDPLDPNNPNNPEYYAPARVRERLAQGARLEPLNRPISLPTALETPLKSTAPDTLRRPLYPQVPEAAPVARESDWRGELFSLAARFALAAGVVTVVALVFFILVPGSRQPDLASSASEATGSTKAAVPPGQDDLGSKPALAQFQRALLGTAAVSTPAAQDQSQELLQKFMGWRKKEDSAATSR
jgi:hypothetical protein